jgi:hypothetical protein
MTRGWSRAIREAIIRALADWGEERKPCRYSRWLVRGVGAMAGIIGAQSPLRCATKLYSNGYNWSMFEVETTEEFDLWFDGIKDSLARRRLALRLRNAKLGNLGDVKPVW